MLLHIDGFDSYSTSSDLTQLEYTTIGPGMQFSTTGGRFGGGTIIANSPGTDNNPVYLVKTLPYSPSEIWMGIAILSPGYNVNTGIFSIISSSGVEAVITYNPGTGVWSAWRGSGSELLASAGLNIGNNSWHWVDFHYIMSTSVGVMEIWVDGTQIVNLTGANTTQNSYTVFPTVSLACSSMNSAMNFDDWYILDTNGSINNTRLGDSRIETLHPSSDAGPNNGTPSTAGPHYLMVNELQWNTSNSIVLTGTSGQEELFGMTSLLTTPMTIHGVRVLATSAKTDAGSLTANTIVSSNSIVAAGNTSALSTTFIHTWNIFETDPSTSNAWIYTAINSMDCGFKIP
jgi:hypothetical protein